MWAVAWLVLAILSCYVRLYPLRAHMWDNAHEQATLYVIYNIKQTFLKQILSEAPNMPPALANHLAEERLNQTMHTENQKVMNAIDKVTISMSGQSHDSSTGNSILTGGQKIYLLESDPYDFYNLTENIVNKGRIADVVKGSKYFNPLMCAPLAAGSHSPCILIGDLLFINFCKHLTMTFLLCPPWLIPPCSPIF